MPLKLLAFVGTRPEANKMAPVIRALRGRAGVECRLVATGQHRDLLQPMLDVFQLTPDFQYDVMTEDQAATAVFESVLHLASEVIERERPDWVLVQGDTATAAAASLAAYLAHVKLGHVEAGLRTYDRQRPFPEEVFRRIADLVADAYFAPTERARQNLLAEGCPEAAVHVTGNTVVDALYQVRDWLADTPERTPSLPEPAAGKRIVLVTVHRRESFGEPLARICDALFAIADGLDDASRVVCTVHPNPNVANVLRERLGAHERISLIEPLDYLDFVALMRDCYLILTDSGGIQEEAPAFGKPVLVLRDVTERPEAVEAGVARLVGTDIDAIVRETRLLLSDAAAYESMARPPGQINPFGDGHAAPRIADILTRDS
ncbi:MAG: UDP-N-acetylglucosamine 2-epimerase (non-hydrolyzing) [Dehalococcoidia bacterium]